MTKKQNNYFDPTNAKSPQKCNPNDDYTATPI